MSRPSLLASQPLTCGAEDLGPEITLENVWQINYGHGVVRAGRKYLLDLEDVAGRELELLRQEGGDTVVELRGCESIPSRRRDGRYASPGFVGIPCRRAQLCLRASFLPGSHLDRRARSGD